MTFWPIWGEKTKRLSRLLFWLTLILYLRRKIIKKPLFLLLLSLMCWSRGCVKEIQEIFHWKANSALQIQFNLHTYVDNVFISSDAAYKCLPLSLHIFSISLLFSVARLYISLAVENIVKFIIIFAVKFKTNCFNWNACSQSYYWKWVLLRVSFHKFTIGKDYFNININHTYLCLYVFIKISHCKILWLYL